MQQRGIVSAEPKGIAGGRLFLKNQFRSIFSANKSRAIRTSDGMRFPAVPGLVRTAFEAGPTTIERT